MVGRTNDIMSIAAPPLIVREQWGVGGNQK